METSVPTDKNTLSMHHPGDLGLSRETVLIIFALLKSIFLLSSFSEGQYNLIIPTNTIPDFIDIRTHLNTIKINL